MTVIMVAFPVLAMPVCVGVAMTVIIVMNSMSPVARAVTPASLAVLVVWTIPVRAGIGRRCVASGNPPIVVSLGRPKASNPNEGWSRRRWRYLITNRRRRNADDNGDLRPGRRRRQGCCNKSERHAVFQHVFSSPTVSRSCIDRVTEHGKVGLSPDTSCRGSNPGNQSPSSGIAKYVR